MKFVERAADLRVLCDDARARGGTVGFVPTMGAFHEGHLSLVRAAAYHDLAVVSLFVNPTQFGSDEDLDAYPREHERDSRLAEAAGADVLFVPDVAEVYPDGHRTTVHVGGLTEGLCGDARPTHFDGVTTVCAELFAMVGPCTAYFGRKDYQQLVVVRRMARDLHLPVEVVGCPLVRGADGLALSSRNAYLSPDERRAARAIPDALRATADLLGERPKDPATVCRLVRGFVAREPAIELEYVEVRDADDLSPVEAVEGHLVVAVAARVGTTRLIDNMILDADGDGITVDLGVTTTESEERECAAR